VIHTCFITLKRSDALEKNVAGAEQEENLVQRGIGPDIDQAQPFRTDQHAHDKKHGDVGDFQLVCEQAGDGADSENEPAGHQRVLRDFD
jgi:hypothetical protein